jgi:hypothetical protein
LGAKRLQGYAKKARIFKYLACTPTRAALSFGKPGAFAKRTGGGSFGGEGAEVKKAARKDDWLLLSQRMQIAHQALQTFLDDVGVDLGRRYVGVAEQRLHDAQIGAVVQKMACEGMTQYVR